MFVLKEYKDDGGMVIEYFGISIRVPDNTVAVATDEDGDVYAYFEKPSLKTRTWNSDMDGYYIGESVFEGDWRDSLMLLGE